MGRALDSIIQAPADALALGAANLIVNPMMIFSQEWGGGGVGTSGSYPMDQWRLNFTGPGIGGGRAAGYPFPTVPAVERGFSLWCGTAKPALAAGDYVSVQQPIEGWRVRLLRLGHASGLPLALGFIIRPNFDATFYANLSNHDGTRSFSRRYTAKANTDNFVELDFPTCPDGSWDYSSGAGLVLRLAFAAGTNFHSTPDQWVTTNTLAAADISNFAASTANSIVFSNVLLFPGRKLPPKELWPLIQRPFDDEERLCMRYWEQRWIVGNPSGSYPAYSWTARKRAAPTLTVTNSSGGGGGTYGTNGSDAFYMGTPHNPPGYGVTITGNARIP